MAIFPTLYSLQQDDQLLIRSATSRRVVNGPGQVIVPPFQRGKRRKAITLEPTQYVRLRNTLTGELRNEVGPKLLFLGANDDVIERGTAIVLKSNQYLRVLDEVSGVTRVERGEKTVILQPNEKTIGGVETGIEIDAQTAVMVRSTRTGQLRLITTPQMFVPTADEEIIETRGRIRLEDHETVVLKDNDGRLIIRRGTDAERAFFLEPYLDLVTFRWSSGLTKDRRGINITHIDARPKYMWYDFEVRTQDNVELQIGLTFFWQIHDVRRLISTTDDATGDVCAHARSRIIQAVSRVTLEAFLASFNEIAAASVLAEDDPFYEDRGVRILSIEVRHIVCKDPGTQRILQEIIQETTNRINRMQKQESENEILIRRIQGETEAEGQRERLLQIQRANHRLAALSAGEGEANRVRAFLVGLGDSLTTDAKIAMFQLLRKGETLQALSEGTAQLYFTPSDVDLSLETKA